MIVHRADRFGLAQLYQLRGRVGREPRARLLLPAGAARPRALDQDARQRLEALREFTELGAGFRIAARDLEIRGAGNLLGGEQSGHIAELGIETYLKMLEETVRELQGRERRGGAHVALDLPVPMTIPRDYIADENLRMEIYRKLADRRAAARRSCSPSSPTASAGRRRRCSRCSTSSTSSGRRDAARAGDLGQRGGS